MPQPVNGWPAPPPSHQSSVQQMTTLHNPFNAGIGFLVFHYDFLSCMNKKFLFYGYTEDGYFRLDNFVFYLVREPELVMMREKFIPPDLQTCASRECALSWKLDDSFAGLVIESIDTKKVLLEINFLGEVTVREPVVPPEPFSTQVTIWDLFSDRSI